MDFLALASETGRVFANVAMDVARVATALGTIDLGAAVSRFVHYREEGARTAPKVNFDFQKSAPAPSTAAPAPAKP